VGFEVPRRRRRRGEGGKKRKDGLGRARRGGGSTFSADACFITCYDIARSLVARGKEEKKGSES